LGKIHRRFIRICFPARRYREKRATTVEQEKKATGKHSWLSRLWARTGFGDKTVWDWLQLLIVPLVLGVIGFYFTSSQEYAHQQEFEEQRLQNAALQTYLAGMRELLLDKKLRDSERDSEARAVARADALDAGTTESGGQENSHPVLV
jgi:uncharacterized protein HemX